MGHRTSIKNPKLTKRLPLEEAETVFLNHCRIKNLSPRTIQYYQEDLEYFFAHLEGIRYADEITREVFEDFLIKQVDAGKKTTSLNTRIRGLRVFFKFCAEREYMEPFPVKLMKEDDTVKEPYTDAEIARLLQKPKTNRWVEWRNWALVNYFVATGNRASTVVNLRVKDIDFEKMTIFLAKVKNRRQQFVPLSGALKDVLLEYLQTWEAMPDDYSLPLSVGSNSPSILFGALSRITTPSGAFQKVLSICSGTTSPKPLSLTVAGYCKDCDALLSSGTVIPATGHTGGTATCKDSAVCEVCHKPYGEKDAANHVGGTEVRGAAEAACTQDGYTGDTYCKGCDALLSSGTAIPAAGEHTGGTPTCLRRAKCKVCGERYGDIDRSNHVDGCVPEWTVTETEHTQKYSRCGKLLTETGAHTFGDWTVTQEPTESEEGEQERVCTVCGCTETEAIPVAEAKANPSPAPAATPEPTAEPAAEPTEPASTGSAWRILLPVGLVGVAAGIGAGIAFRRRKKK